jgi:fructan beta-fructosidase
VSGFGSEEGPALLAFYTSHHPVTKREEQCVAVSKDGIHFTKYEMNPIIPGKENTPARDPFVFENKVIGGYSLCITTEDEIRFFHSLDLLHWEESGRFNLPSGVFRGMIECPVIFNSNGKYILMMSMDIPETEFEKFPPGVEPHNRLMQYLVGEFDGRTFIASETNSLPLLVDEGCDFYAGTIFNNIDETVLMAWLGNSEKVMSIPTDKEGFRGVLSFPRKLLLVETEDGYRLRHEFYPDLSTDFADGKKIEDSFVLEILSKEGFKSATNCIRIG